MSERKIDATDDLTLVDCQLVSQCSTNTQNHVNMT